MVTTDWQPKAIASILSHKLQSGHERVVAYTSNRLIGAERSWTATEGECFMVVHCVKLWRLFLVGQAFTLITDHIALKSIMTASDTSRKWTRWVLKIRSYDSQVVQKPGKENTNADGLIRLRRGDDNGVTSPPLTYLLTGADISAASNARMLSEDAPMEVRVAATTEADAGGDAAVHVARVCKGCKAHEPQEELITCSCYENAYPPIKCVTPAVYEITEDWCCGVCGGTADLTAVERKTLDITLDEDTPTLPAAWHARWMGPQDQGEGGSSRQAVCVHGREVVHAGRRQISSRQASPNDHREATHRDANTQGGSLWYGYTAQAGEQTILLARHRNSG
jgi:hypothetical protein